MPSDTVVFLQDILDCIDLIESYTRNLAKSAFLDSKEKQDAVIRRLEIIGEATRRLPKEFTAAHPEVPWPRMIAMRNRLIHAYGRVDLELTWVVVERDLPKLKRELGALLENRKGSCPKDEL